MFGFCEELSVTVDMKSIADSYCFSVLLFSLLVLYDDVA